MIVIKCEGYLEAVDEQLKREPKPLPDLVFSEGFYNSIDDFNNDRSTIDDMINHWGKYSMELRNYEHHGKLDAETKLFTGLTK